MRDGVAYAAISSAERLICILLQSKLYSQADLNLPSTNYLVCMSKLNVRVGVD